jgi:predicted CoA-substrate-specific enzyme activase
MDIMLKAGIDVGSVNTVIVLFDCDHGKIMNHLIASLDETGLTYRGMFKKMLDRVGVKREKINSIVATGRGRSLIDFADRQSSEVVCQAKAAKWLFPYAGVVINLGAETSRVIQLGDNGRATSFAANDKCAAGSGLFLDSMAHLMNIPVTEIGPMALKAGSGKDVSSRCAVFAESEVISHIHQGIPKEEILAGIHRALADRILDLCSRITIKPDVVVTGGVAKNPAIIAELKRKLNLTIHIPAEPQIMGALGAALID